MAPANGYTYHNERVAGIYDDAAVVWDICDRRAPADVQHDAVGSSTSRQRHMTSDMMSSWTTMTRHS